MTEVDFLERIATELCELNATLSCRFDALDEIAHQLKLISYGTDLTVADQQLTDIASDIRYLAIRLAL
jgi:hypothetical protein